MRSCGVSCYGISSELIATCDDSSMMSMMGCFLKEGTEVYRDALIVSRPVRPNWHVDRANHVLTPVRNLLGHQLPAGLVSFGQNETGKFWFLSSSVRISARFLTNVNCRQHDAHDGVNSLRKRGSRRGAALTGIPLGMPIRQVDLCRLWGASSAYVSVLVKRGLPLTSADEAEAWMLAHLIKRPRLRIGVAKNQAISPKEIARTWGVSTGAIYKRLKAGMPLTSLADAEAWVRASSLRTPRLKLTQ
jgi:hypothetical protein